MNDGFTKLFSTIITSSIWSEDNETRVVWITMLALADFEGKVDGSIPGLARLANVPIDACQKALDRLKSPDIYSRSKENDGRRIKEIEGGWMVLNLIKYREKKIDRRAYLRQKQREHRQREKEKMKEKEKDTTYYIQHNVSTLSTSVDNKMLTYTLEDCQNQCILKGIPDNKTEEYYHHFKAQGFIRANGQPITDLGSHIWSMWDKSKKQWKFSGDKSGKHKLPIIAGKNCSVKGCGLPAVYKSSSGSYDSYCCENHLPDKIKEKYK